MSHTGLDRRQLRSVHARCNMVARESVRQRHFRGVRTAGTSTPHGNTVEELDEIEEELQVMWASYL